MGISAVASAPLGLFPSRKLDFIFVLGLPLLGIFSALAVVYNPDWFELVLTADLWLLGYHHVISTYSRLLMDSNTKKEYWYLIYVLPLVVVAVVWGMVAFFGVASIATLYLYWQWFHYLRQSEGVAKAFAGKVWSGFKFDLIDRAAIYLVPLGCFMWMLSRGQQEFLGMAIWSLAIPESVSQVILALGCAAAVVSIIRLMQKNGYGKIFSMPMLYLYSHWSIFMLAYVVIERIDHGWLAINIWHNAQYILFVWLFNRNKNSGDAGGKTLIWWLSQPGRSLIYFLFFVLVTALVYLALDKIVLMVSPDNFFVVALLIYSSINFHHYIVDSMIWKLRKQRVSKYL